MAIVGLCDFADYTAAESCGEVLNGIASVIYVGFKNDLTALPKLKVPGDSATNFGLGDYSYIEEEPGFLFKTGKRFYKFEIATDSGQFTASSVETGKGFTQQLVFKIEKMTPELATMLRTINNRKDVFFVFPEGDQYQAFYDPDRNRGIASGGIAYDSGNTPDSDSGATLTATLMTRTPKTYYKGTVSTTPAT
ncbi:MAG: hypothetical protein LBQ39_01970 [Tannerellaceae bacterium]|jgi:hypothetical protein|nr:hypothetical protein [Tannerellaceae bacterium]